MNEYTYKAKKLEDGEWTTGSLFAGLNHHLILQGINLKEMVVNCSEVDKETICRHAGNGFWEHDIIRYKDAIGVIKYGVHGRSYGFYVEWNNDVYADNLLSWICDEEVNVIGNEIDNPELLDA